MTKGGSACRAAVGGARRFVWGRGGWLLTPRQLSKRRRSWEDDLYGCRKETIELLFQPVIQACSLKCCPAKGLTSDGALFIASVWLYSDPLPA